MIIDDLHASPWIFDDCCRWYVRLQEQLLQRVCGCCKQGRMAQRYIQSTTAQLKRSAKNINLQQPATFTASGRVWKTTCFETAVAVHRELGCWWLLRSRATWIWPWSWSITPSLKPNSCDYFQCEACNIEFIHVFHDPTTDSPRTVSETFGDQSTTEFQIVEATASFSERERDTKATCGSSSNTCGTLWNMTCGLYLWDPVGSSFYQPPVSTTERSQEHQESVMLQGQTGRLSHAGWKHASPPQRESLCCVFFLDELMI